MLPLLYHPRRQLSGAITTPKRFTAKISTNLGPLLSTFTPSAACASNTGLTVFDQGPITVYWAEGPMSTGSQGCYPSSYSPDLFHYYSPGLCPSGYTTACTSLNSIGTVTETIHTCCPKWVWSCDSQLTIYMHAPKMHSRSIAHILESHSQRLSGL